jgi:hypothetical protein
MSVPVVLLAGGLGTRLREETDVKPKPMVEVGGHPILWHIMKSYAAHGFDEFVVCLGYKGDSIKDFFLNYRSRQGGVSVDLASGRFDMHDPSAGESWKVHLLETGHDTMTGGGSSGPRSSSAPSLHGHLRRRRGRHRPARSAGLSRGCGRPGDADRGAPAGSLRRA